MLADRHVSRVIRKVCDPVNTACASKLWSGIGPLSWANDAAGLSAKMPEGLLVLLLLPLLLWHLLLLWLRLRLIILVIYCRSYRAAAVDVLWCKAWRCCNCFAAIAAGDIAVRKGRLHAM